MRKARVAAIVVIFLLAAVGPVVATAPGSNAHTRGVVVFAGDSNIYLNAYGITSALTGGDHLDNGYVPVMASRPGVGVRSPDCAVAVGCTTFDYWKVKLSGLLPNVNASVFVTNLGINDTTKSGTDGGPGYLSYNNKIDWFMRLIPAGRLVIWSNLPCAIEPSARLTGCRTINYALARAKSRWPNLVVADWATTANSHPEYMASPGTDVHLSPAGHAAWIRLVVKELDARSPAV